MNSTRQIFGTNHGSNRPVSPRQRALFARGHLGRGHVTVPEATWPVVDAANEVVSAAPRFLVDFNGQRPAGMTVTLRSVSLAEPSLPAAA